jgi:hypothetical protein
MVVNLKPLVPHRVWIPPGALDSFMWGSYPASLWNVGGSTQVSFRAWNAWKGTWGLPQPVKLESHQITFTVSVWLKPTQTNKHYICKVISSGLCKLLRTLLMIDIQINMLKVKVTLTLMTELVWPITREYIGFLS